MSRPPRTTPHQLCLWQHRNTEDICIFDMILGALKMIQKRIEKRREEVLSANGLTRNADNALRVLRASDLNGDEEIDDNEAAAIERLVAHVRGRLDEERRAA